MFQLDIKPLPTPNMYLPSWAQIISFTGFLLSKVSMEIYKSKVFKSHFFITLSIDAEARTYYNGFNFKEVNGFLWSFNDFKSFNDEISQILIIVSSDPVTIHLASGVIYMSLIDDLCSFYWLISFF